MNQKSLIGIVVGLMIAISTVYFVETIEEFEEQEIVINMKASIKYLNN